nr:MAG TPA: hypothetical protein [Caudoviricetes sp.]DAT11391.1 MAG TPA: hypothetical protein [Caudoviricetes sp.]
MSSSSRIGSTFLTISPPNYKKRQVVPAFIIIS